MLPRYLFTTEGNWDSTLLQRDGETLDVLKLKAYFQQTIDKKGNPIGVGELNAVLVFQDDPNTEVGIFPGTIEFQLPGNKIEIKNEDPAVPFAATTVEYQEIEMTTKIIEFSIEIDAVDNVAQSWIRIFEGPPATGLAGLGHAEAEPSQVGTFNLL